VTSIAGVMDTDLTTTDGGANYAPCVSCHNPHGTRTNDTGGETGSSADNRMIVDTWSTSSSLCRTCHP
jgi:hypothetical protein